MGDVGKSQPLGHHTGSTGAELPTDVEREPEREEGLVEDGAGGLHWIDPSGRILWASRAEIALLGYEPEEYIGRNIAEFHVDGAVIEDILSRLGQDGAPSDHEVRLRCKDGSIRTALIGSWQDRDLTRPRPSPHDSTGPQAVTGAGPWSSQEQLQVIIDAVPALIAYVDAGGRYQLINKAYEGWLGAESSAYRGRRVREVLGEARWAAVRQHAETALAGTPVSFELRIPGQGGERWVRAHYTPHVGPDGRILGYVALLHDISESKRAEQRLAQLAEASEVLGRSLDYETTLANTVALVLPALGDFGFFDILEADGTVRRIARAYGDPRRQAILDRTHWKRSTRDDLNLCALSSGRSGFYPDIDDAWLRDAATCPEHLALMRSLAFRSMLTVPLVYQEETLGALTLFFADSERRHTAADLSLAEELARRAAASLQNARLYRDLKGANARQQEADRRKDEFLAMLGHELRNPLAPILTALQLMELRGDPSTQRERDVIKRQARHLIRLVDDLLDVSRVTRGKIELKTERLELSSVVARAIEMASPLFEQRCHNLTVRVPRAGLLVEADPMRLAQILSNLLANAAKYTEPGGEITISADRDGGEAVVRVEDNGMGIPPELLPRIFDLFVQGRRTLDRAQGGLGLGLALVRSLTELHGGRVFAHSDGSGRGSTFTVRLPLVDPAELPAGERTASARRGSFPGARSDTRRVLVVDDNVDAADTLAQALREAGHEVAIAHDGPTALALAEQFQPEVALLDIGLPVMDGYELCTRLREMVAGRRALRLIAVTGYGQDADRARSSECGFDLHLVKPVDLETIASLVVAPCPRAPKAS